MVWGWLSCALLSRLPVVACLHHPEGEVGLADIPQRQQVSADVCGASPDTVTVLRHAGQ
jgi:hypothetical protein